MGGRPTDMVQSIRDGLQKVRPGATPAEVRNRIAELCQENDYDPVLELLYIAKNASMDVVNELVELKQSVRSQAGQARLDRVIECIARCGVGPDATTLINIHKEILQYIAPKLRSMEVKGTQDLNLTIEVKKFSEEVDDDGRGNQRTA